MANDQTAEDIYLKYVQENIFSFFNQQNCLKPTQYIATRSDGRKVKVTGIYDWIGEGENKNLFQPHFLLEFMRKLRNAGEENPAYSNQLYNQVEYLISKAVMRNGALVWENPEGIAQGMEQAEYGDYFASVANIFKLHNDIRTARGFMSYSLLYFNSLNIQAGIRTGGVSSIRTNAGSGVNDLRPCWWFHSRGLAVTDAPGIRTVLNQHLHVIQGLLSACVNIHRSPDLIKPEFGSKETVLGYLTGKALGGLYQLAYTNGHRPGFPLTPPNIKQFMKSETRTVKPTPEQPDGNPLTYYWAYYEYIMSEDKGSNISPENTCHYHTHVLNLVASIKGIMDKHETIFRDLQVYTLLLNVVDELLKGEATEPAGLPNSPHAIYQFYRSEGPAYKKRRQKCLSDKDEDQLSDEAIEFYRRHYDL